MEEEKFPCNNCGSVGKEHRYCELCGAHEMCDDCIDKHRCDPG